MSTDAVEVDAFTTHLVVDGAADASAFYQRAFGAVECNRITLPDGRLIHVELRMGPATFMLADEFPDHGALGPRSRGGTVGVHYLHTSDAQSLWAQAVAAGATVSRPLGPTFWGEVEGQVEDPFGHRWGITQHVEDVSIEVMSARAAEAFAPQAS